MIQWLTNLPKLIDAFISGVIEFCYRFLDGVVVVSRHPIHGARELEANEEQLSSRTMLFGAAAIFLVLAYFRVGVVGALSGVGLIRFLIMIIVVYIVFDALAAVGSKPCSRRRPAEACDKVRDYLRYAFAASLVIIALAIAALIALIKYFPIDVDGQSPGQMLGATLLYLALLAVILLGFYQPAAIVVHLAGWVGSRFARVVSAALLSVVMSVVVGGLLTGFLLSFTRIVGAVEGPVFVTPVSCAATGSGVRAVLVVDNTALTATYFSRRTLKLRLGYNSAGTPAEAIAAAHEDVALTGVDGDLAIVDAHGYAKLVVTARPHSPVYREFLATGRPGGCQVIKGLSSRDIEPSEIVPLDPLPDQPPTSAPAP